jgi:hypothetical protein
VANPLTRSLASLFRSKADTTSLKRLQREGIRTVGVLDLGQLEEIVGEAIERALAEASPDGTSPHAVAQGAQVEFLKLLGADGRLGDKRDEFSRQSATLAANLGALQQELSEQQSALEKQQAAADRSAMNELRELLDRSLHEAFERAGKNVSSISPEASEALADMQEPLRAAMLSLLAAALRRSRPGEPTAEETEVELLNRRVKKLTAQLQETEELLDRIRLEKAAEADAVPSIYREVQGLKGTEDRIEQRRALMREIFEHNVELRRTLAGQNAAAIPPASPS